MTDAKHEAPAEGAGEFARQMEILRKAASVPVPDDDSDFTVEKARRGSESWRVIAANVLREYDRARSSAPEAREGEAVAWGARTVETRAIYPSIRATKRGAERMIEGIDAKHEHRLSREPIALYTHPAAPSADKLRDVLVDLTSWFTKPVQGQSGMVWVIPAGERGADDALNAALAALKAEGI